MPGVRLLLGQVGSAVAGQGALKIPSVLPPPLLYVPKERLLASAATLPTCWQPFYSWVTPEGEKLVVSSFHIVRGGLCIR